jgi:transcriptional regulator with XRE-family HTH domain
MARIDVSSLGSYIREQRTSAELSIRELARVTGVSNPYLSQVERGIRQPSAQTLSRVADALRISAEQLYVRAGFLDRASDVTGAITDDPVLTAAERAQLLAMYDKFVAAHKAAKKTRPTAAKKTASAKKAAAKPVAKKTAAKPVAKKAAPKTTKTAATKKVAATKTSAVKTTKGLDR